MKKLFKTGKKLTNPQNKKTQKQTNLSIFCRLNNEFYTIFYGIGYTCNNILLIWRVTAIWMFLNEKISKILC